MNNYVRLVWIVKNCSSRNVGDYFKVTECWFYWSWCYILLLVQLWINSDESAIFLGLKHQITVLICTKVVVDHTRSWFQTTFGLHLITSLTMAVLISLRNQKLTFLRISFFYHTEKIQNHFHKYTKWLINQIDRKNRLC